MENAVLIALAHPNAEDGWKKIDMLRRAADKLGMRVCAAEVCSPGQSEMIHRLAPGDHVLVDDTDVVGDTKQLLKLLTTCYYGAMEFILVKSEEEMYGMLPSLTANGYCIEIFDIHV